ncbi:MAG: Ku protein, partial [Nitriliruptorales bacterium]|nr:Ku protein [Nitriliruptorales bacterium]
TAVKRKSVSFREIRRSDASRIRHRKVAQADGEEVASDDIAKGYEIAPDRYIVVDPEELKALDPEGSRTIDIVDFVDLADIDPIFYDSSYYLAPGDTAAKPYRLLHDAMSQTGKAAVARFVLRTKQYLAIIRPLGPALAVSTVVYADEIVEPGAVVPDEVAGVEVNEKELAMATQLIESMATEWDPEQYRDEYRERVLELLERKAEGEDVVTVPADEREAGELVDLMSALEASLQAAKDAQTSDTA